MPSPTPPPAVALAPEAAPASSAQAAPIPAAAWALLAVLSLIWGTSFILMKKGLVVFSALELGACRVSVAALLLLPFALREARRIERGRLK